MTAMTLSIVALLLGLGALSCLVTGWLRAPLSRHAMDIPNERSAHSQPIPRGGGSAIWLACSLGLVALALLQQISPTTLIAFLGAGSIAALSGLLDDLAKHGIKAETRLLFHLGGVIWGMAWLGGVEGVQLGTFYWQWGYVEHILLALVLVWIINLTNFMDGLNGLAASETLFVVLLASLLAGASGDHSVFLLGMMLVASIAGFLPWNAGKAKIFLGDSGSYFLGMMIALLSLTSARNMSVPPWCWMILYSVFIADSFVALARRMTKSRTAWKEAHRTHACQHLSRRWKSHGKVSLAVGALNIFVLAPLALLAWIHPVWAVVLGVFVLAVMMVLAMALGSGIERDYSAGSNHL